jgi:penicillin-binding protein 1A
VAAFTFVTFLTIWMRVCAGTRCPSIEGLDSYDPDQASKVYAADGRLITDLGKERRTVVSLDEMSPAVIAAFLTTEDKRFFEHRGIDWVRFFGALKANLLAGAVREGFSTITMQLAGNLFPEDINRQDRSLGRKLREAHVAREIEQRYPKRKILELYLNQIDLGNRAFGVEAASQRYFGKSARDLNVAEAATLAAMPKAPSRYNPRRHPRRAIQRRNLIVGLLADQGYLTNQEAERWRAYPLLLSSRDDYSGIAEYFVEYVRQQLDARFGGRLYTDGLRIYTTVDLDVQQAAERALDASLPRSGRRTAPAAPDLLRVSRAKAETEEDVEHTAVPAGSSRYRSTRVMGTFWRWSAAGLRGQQVQSCHAGAPPAPARPSSHSCTAALQGGIPLSTVMVDEPITVEMPGGQPPWEPKNYDNEFQGPMTLRQALYKSVNIVAVKLGMEIGEESVISEATRFGIVSERIPPYPSIHLGSAVVRPIELIGAYTAFANGGERVSPVGILRVEDRDGDILWEPRARRERVMDPPLAWLMNDLLQDVVQRGTGHAAGAGLGFPVGGKTGTTNDGFDVWFVGFTSNLVTGMWIGLDRPEKIKANAQGGVLVAPAWRQMMGEVYERRPTPRGWSRPDSLISAGDRPDDRIPCDALLPIHRPRHGVVPPRHRTE